MPEHKHTPGNWVARGTLGPASNPHIRGPWVIEADGKRIATLRLLGGPEQELDARLIAAAPSLLKALIEVTASLAWNAHGECRAIHDGPIMPSAMAVEMARAAIAKATGQA